MTGRLKQLLAGWLGLLLTLNSLPLLWAAEMPRDIKGHWSEAVLLRQWERGILTGERQKEGFYLRPNRPVSRAELVVVLLRNGYVLAQPLAKEPVLPGDSRGHWAAPYLAQAQAQGLLKGYPDGSFKPDRQVTRAELAVLLARLPGLPAKGSGDDKKLPQDVRGHWAEEEIKRLVTAGIIQGYPDGSFQPERAASRAEVAVLLDRLWPAHTPPDQDGDGLNDGLEARLNTNAQLVDSDFDGVRDGEEGQLGLDPLRPDSDDDGLSDQEEILLQTDPRRRDSNGNGRSDGEELYPQTYYRADKPLQPAISALLPAPAIYALAVREKGTKESLALQNNPALLGSALEVIAAPRRQGSITLQADLALAAAGGAANLLVAHYRPERGQMEYFSPRILEDGRIRVEAVELAGTWYLVDRRRLGQAVSREELKERDVLLLVDASGSMGTVDKEGYRLELAADLVQRLGAADRVAIMAFTEKTELLVPLTVDKARIRTALTGIGSDGDTDLQGAVAAGIDYMLREGRPQAEKSIVLFTEGHNTRPEVLWELGEKAGSSGIRIHTLGLGVGVHGVLRDLAEAGGGQYQDDWHGEELLALYPPAPAEDRDGDGLPDGEERQGLLTQYGQVIFTDPERADTDGDGLTDGEEMGISQAKPFGLTAQMAVPGYNIQSNPLFPDTDGDGLPDKEDPRPQVPDWPILVLLHGLFSDRTIWGMYKDREHIAPDSFLGYWREMGYNLEQVLAYQYPSTEHVSRVAASLAAALPVEEKKRHPYGKSYCYLLLGHSKGGLVARYVVEHSLFRGRPVLGLFTLGTPHWGWSLLSGFYNDLAPDSELFVVQEREPLKRICQPLTGKPLGVPYIPLATEYNSWTEKLVIADEEVAALKKAGDWVVGNTNALAQGIPARKRYLLRTPEKYYHWESHHNSLVWATVWQETEKILGSN
ncbi:S-layer homology domain-containing protein [Carboxydocella sp. ULO1]|uniref:S-layer homology domain-containing protein n=1 Tax=Carboxydocella sp. ULO1 TaxID=1926599 RepID=UPI0009ADF2FF|nr:S-layer homology domain-containing protein [Carboxydocella sp. ULO1]GAW29131.1 hypothetical protein ULO1_17010 [Carboxydocella sp. ULO1]